MSPGIQVFDVNHLDKMSLVHNMALSTIRINRFVICGCQSSRFSTKHIALETWDVELNNAKAAALSYAVGDYDRDLHIIGHYKGAPTRTVNLSLGAEWNVDDLLTSLNDLSKKYEGLWLDQLSLPKDNRVIVRYLQSMPTIYRTLDVVVLFPNAPCPCLARGVRAGRLPRWPIAFDLAKKSKARACINAFPVSSYHVRLWTKLEFAYSRRISAYNVSGPLGPCTKDHDWSQYKQASAFLSRIGNKYLQQLWTRARSALGSYGEDVDLLAWSWLFKHIEICLKDYELGFMVYCKASRSLPVPLLAKFLTGAQLERCSTEDDKTVCFSDFETVQRATVGSDLVTAVFTKFEGYCIPQSLDSLPITVLFEDAIRQVEALQNRLYLTSSPGGLFGATTTSGSQFASIKLDPTVCMKLEKVKTLNHLFGKLAGHSWVSTVSNQASLMLQHAQHCSAPRPTAVSFASSAHAKKSTVQIIDWLRKTMRPQFWSYWIHPHSTHTYYSVADFGPVVYESSNETTASKCAAIRYCKNTEQKVSVILDIIRSDLDTYGVVSELPHFDPEELCYRLVCRYLQLNVDVARRSGLGLVLRPNSPSCLGMFSKRAYEALRASETGYGNQGPDSRTSWLAVNIRDSHSLDPDPTNGVSHSAHHTHSFSYEACSSVNSPKTDICGREVPEYNIVGVWLGRILEGSAKLTTIPQRCDAVLR